MFVFSPQFSCLCSLRYFKIFCAATSPVNGSCWKTDQKSKSCHDIRSKVSRQVSLQVYHYSTKLLLAFGRHRSQTDLQVTILLAWRRIIVLPPAWFGRWDHPFVFSNPSVCPASFFGVWVWVSMKFYPQYDQLNWNFTQIAVKMPT